MRSDMTRYAKLERDLLKRKLARRLREETFPQRMIQDFRTSELTLCTIISHAIKQGVLARTTLQLRALLQTVSNFPATDSSRGMIATKNQLLICELHEIREQRRETYIDSLSHCTATLHQRPYYDYFCDACSLRRFIVLLGSPHNPDLNDRGSFHEVPPILLRSLRRI
jgi:hypothetical protein